MYGCGHRQCYPDLTKLHGQLHRTFGGFSAVQDLFYSSSDYLNDRITQIHKDPSQPCRDHLIYSGAARLYYTTVMSYLHSLSRLARPQQLLETRGRRFDMITTKRVFLLTAGTGKRAGPSLKESLGPPPHRLKRQAAEDPSDLQSAVSSRCGGNRKDRTGQSNWQFLFDEDHHVAFRVP